MRSRAAAAHEIRRPNTTKAIESASGTPQYTPSKRNVVAIVSDRPAAAANQGSGLAVYRTIASRASKMKAMYGPSLIAISVELRMESGMRATSHPAVAPAVRPYTAVPKR